MSEPNKRLAIENHQSSNIESITDDQLASVSSEYRVIGTHYGYRLHFDGVLFHAELIQHGLKADHRLLGHRYLIAYVLPDTDLYGRNAIKHTLSNCPIAIPSKSLQSSLNSYIKSERFRARWDHFKMKDPIALLCDGRLIQGNSAYKIYTQGLTVFDRVKVDWAWIPYEMRPKENRKNKDKPKAKPIKRYSVEYR
jgi:hypothetical protein